MAGLELHGCETREQNLDNLLFWMDFYEEGIIIDQVSRAVSALLTTVCPVPRTVPMKWANGVKEHEGLV